MTIRPIKELVAEAKTEITSLSVAEVLTQKSAGNALLIDIREPHELARDGRIPGALHIPRGMLEFWIDPTNPSHKPELSTDKTSVLFCASSWRSALSAKLLQNMGANNIAELDGGFGAWKDAGEPIEKDTLFQ